MIELHSALYGTVSTDPYLPEPSEVIDIFLTYPVLIVTDNGDGTATITGPDEAVYMLDSITARIHWPSVRPVTMDKYNISSM